MFLSKCIAASSLRVLELIWKEKERRNDLKFSFLQCMVAFDPLE